MTNMYTLIGVTRCGRKHAENQDRILTRTIDWPGSTGDIHLAGVADGISGSAFGGSVADWVIDGHLVADNVFSASAASLGEQLQEHLCALADTFTDEFVENEAMLNSGAALSVAGIHDGTADCFWAGDAPIFINRMSDKYSGEQISAPDLDPARKLTNYFGKTSAFNPHRKQIRMSPGDILTIASDGACIDEYVLKDTYNTHGCTRSALKTLIDLALKSPRADDASIVAVLRNPGAREREGNGA